MNVLSLLDDRTLMELWNGAWFALGLAMVTSFILIAFHRVLSRHRRTDRPIYRDMVFQSSIALCTFSAASSIRAGYIWMLLHCENLRGVNNCPFIEMNAWVLSVGAALAIVSGLCIIRIFTPSDWSPWIWISAALAAIGGPIVFYISTRGLNFISSQRMVIEGRYDPFLVIVSILIAICASFTALQLMERSREMFGYSSWLWTISAGVTMGGGIWSMHFIAMLSFTLRDTTIGYDVFTTAISLVIPMVVTLVGFLAIKGIHPGGFMPMFGGGLFIGAGIATMHYTGMAAMRMSFVDMIYDPMVFFLSVLIAVVASASSLWVSFSGDLGGSVMERKILAAIIGGIAVSGMHYTAMAATTFHMTDRIQWDQVDGINQTSLALGVTATSAVILAAFITALVYDRYRKVTPDTE